MMYSINLSAFHSMGVWGLQIGRTHIHAALAIWAEFASQLQSVWRALVRPFRQSGTDSSSSSVLVIVVVVLVLVVAVVVVVKAVVQVQQKNMQTWVIVVNVGCPPAPATQRRDWQASLNHECCYYLWLLVGVPTDSSSRRTVPKCLVHEKHNLSCRFVRNSSCQGVSSPNGEGRNGEPPGMITCNQMDPGSTAGRERAPMDQLLTFHSRFHASFQIWGFKQTGKTTLNYIVSWSLHAHIQCLLFVECVAYSAPSEHVFETQTSQTYFCLSV